MEPVIGIVQRYRTASDFEGREAAALDLLDVIGPELFRLVRRRSRAGCEEDVNQEVLKAIFSQLLTCPAETDAVFWAWCRSIARNKAADSLREMQRKPEVATDPDELRRYVETSDMHQPANFEERDLLDRALQLIRKVQPPCQELLIRAFLLEEDYATLAESLKTSYDAIRMRVKRCLELAQELLIRDLSEKHE